MSEKNTKVLKLLLRNALFAVLARVTLGLIRSLLRRGQQSLLKRIMNETLSMDLLKWGVAISGFSCLRFVEQATLRVVPSREFAAAFAGFLSVIPLRVFQPRIRAEFAMYVVIRALHAFSVTEVLPRMPPRIRDFQHYEAVSMALCSVEILYCCMFMPHCHATHYQRFLERCTMVDTRVLAGTAGMHRRQIVPELIDYASKHPVPLPDPDKNMRVLCAYYHPNESCTESAAKFLVRHFTRISLPLYLPLKLLATIVLKPKKLLTDSWKTVRDIVLTTAQSSMFLTLYCAGPLAMICVSNRLNMHSPIGLALLTGVAGFATVVEAKSRQLDLALYCAAHAARSGAMVLWYRGWTNKPSLALLEVLEGISMGYIYFLYSCGNEKLHVSVRAGLARLLGESQPTKQARE